MKYTVLKLYDNYLLFKGHIEIFLDSHSIWGKEEWDLGKGLENKIIEEFCGRFAEIFNLDLDEEEYCHVVIETGFFE